MFTESKTKIFCAVTWIIGFIYNVPNFIPGIRVIQCFIVCILRVLKSIVFLPGWSKYEYDRKEYDCLVDRKKKIYMIIFSVTGIIIPCFAMAFCYLSIFLHARRVKSSLREKHLKSKSESLRLAKSLFASFSLFFFCW